MSNYGNKSYRMHVSKLNYLAEWIFIYFKFDFMYMVVKNFNLKAFSRVCLEIITSYAWVVTMLYMISVSYIKLKRFIFQKTRGTIGDFGNINNSC